MKSKFFESLAKKMEEKERSVTAIFTVIVLHIVLRLVSAVMKCHSKINTIFTQRMPTVT